MNWLKMKIAEWFHEPLSERDKAHRVAVGIVQALLDQSKIPDLTPPGYTVELSQLDGGGFSGQGNHIECSFRLYVKVMPSDSRILRETLEERRKIQDVNAKYIQELEDQLSKGE